MAHPAVRAMLSRCLPVRERCAPRAAAAPRATAAPAGGRCHSACLVRARAQIEREIEVTMQKIERLKPMAGEELDKSIAGEVFGISPTAIDAWPWGVPPFSTDRNCSAAVVAKMLAHPALDQFDTELRRAALRWGWGKRKTHEGPSALVLVLTPDEICRAALRAIHEYSFSAQS